MTPEEMQTKELIQKIHDIRWKVEPDKKFPYITRRYHEGPEGSRGYPGGSRCIVWRDDDGDLFSEFEDGIILNLGKNFYLRGIEKSLLGDAREDTIDAMDAEVIAEINAYCIRQTETK